MTDIVRLETPDGTVHWTARDSETARRLTRDGAVDLDAPKSEEDTGGESPGQGDDPDTGAAGGGSRKRQRTTGATDRGDGAEGAV